MSEFTTCPTCSGFGHVWTGEDVTWCRQCNSTGRVAARDERGRFIRVTDRAGDGCEPSEASHK